MGRTSHYFRLFAQLFRKRFGLVAVEAPPVAQVADSPMAGFSCRDKPAIDCEWSCHPGNQTHAETRSYQRAKTRELIAFEG
jgi:hypothetical protein